MITPNSFHTCLAIVGNGFDLAHGYRTSYDNFTTAIGEGFFSEYKNYLNTYCGCHDAWNHFEKQVETITAAFYQKVLSDEGLDDNVIRKFNTAFLLIKEKLVAYLQSEIASKSFHKIDTVKRHLENQTVVLNFNYTNTVEHYLRDIIYVHGSVNEGEIVLGYDPTDALCLASYENRKWFKPLCRDRLAFKRDIKEKFNVTSNDALYLELCNEYEQILSWKESGKGLEDEDVAKLAHAIFFHEYMESRSDNNITFPNIKKLVLLGHSIQSDETYLSEVLNKCQNLKKVIIFSYAGEPQNEWDKKAHFFAPYCKNIVKELY